MSYLETLGDGRGKGSHSQVTFMIFLCLNSHGGQPSVVV